MKIYHGSQFIIEKPGYRKGKAHNDYGYGFYCTEYPDLARERSVDISHDGYINCYELDTTELTMLDLNHYGTLTWLSILLENRVFDLNTPLSREAADYIKNEFYIDYSGYDLIKGYRADDCYFSFAYDFINGAISLEQLSEAMHLGELGNQIVLKSRQSFERIKLTGAEEVKKEIWLPKKEARNIKAKKAYHSIDKKYIKGDLYILRILDEEIKRNDARLR